jgi:predicted RNA binding protein YcfA (HicA-like mRNA interferase family)
MKVRDVTRRIEDDGWRFERLRASVRSPESASTLLSSGTTDTASRKVPEVAQR